MAEKKTITIDSAHCKACQYCIDACPKQALALGQEINTAGYTYVQADVQKCIGCGICYVVCPDYVFTVIEEEGA